MWTEEQAQQYGKQIEAACKRSGIKTGTVMATKRPDGRPGRFWIAEDEDGVIKAQALGYFVVARDAYCPTSVQAERIYAIEDDSGLYQWRSGYEPN